MARPHARLELERLESRDAPANLNTPYFIANGVISEPSSAINAHGERVVVWSQQNGVLDADIWAQRFRANGDKNGAPIRVTTSTDPEVEPDVAIDFLGNFYVTDTRVSLGLNNSQIEVRRFTANGAQVTLDMIPPASPIVSVHDSHVACSGAGAAVVSYTESSIFGDENVLARLYQPNRLIPQRNIPVATSNSVEADSDVASMNQVLPGNVVSFAIVYTVNGTDVFARRYRANGDLLNANNPALPIAIGPLNETNPSIAANTLGQFAVAWEQQTSFFAGSDIFARTFNSAAIPQLGEARAIATGTTDDTDPSVGIRNNGRIVVAYSSQPPGVFNFTINVTEVDDTLRNPIPHTQAVAQTGFGPFAGFSTLSVDPNDPNGGYFVAYSAQNGFALGASLFAQVRRI
jgi:hypothetical protein